MTLLDAYHTFGAKLAPDNIPLHFGNAEQEFLALYQQGIMLDRSHEGRLRVSGNDRHALLDRMSTNDVEKTAVGERRATIFTNPNGRILFRVTIFNEGESLLLITEPGQASQVTTYLHQNIFFRDDVRIESLQNTTFQFSLHGNTLNKIIETNSAYTQKTFLDSPLIILQRQAYVGKHLALIGNTDDAGKIFTHLANHLQPSGGVVFNLMRIQSGSPARSELTADYLPLELGLWDEISFTKGCYTGQEIIARMDSRQQIAKHLVHLMLDAYVDAPNDIYANQQVVGKLTSSVAAPDGSVYALGVVKRSVIEESTPLAIGTDRISATIDRLAGTPPPYLQLGDPS